jgi:hypothetical protein
MMSRLCATPSSPSWQPSRPARCVRRRQRQHQGTPPAAQVLPACDADHHCAAPANTPHDNPPVLLPSLSLLLVQVTSALDRLVEPLQGTLQAKVKADAGGWPVPVHPTRRGQPCAWLVSRSLSWTC